MEAKKANDAEKELITAINKGNIDEVRRLLSLPSVCVNCQDEQGMTPLMHVAYKGYADITELLLAHGADVNSNQHEHRYSALMFSCVAGASDVTRLLLEAGANVNAENNLGKTAAQLGAFVGQHECVSILNNFISKDDLHYYTKPQGFEKEGKLQAKLVPTLYKYVTQATINPVKLVYFLRDHLDLIENYQSIHKVLGLMCEKFIKQKSMNEVIAMKVHYYGYTVKKCARWHEGLEGKDGIDGLLKFLIRGRPSDGFPLGMEDFIRQSIKDFEYPQCTIFQQLVSTLSPVERGDEPTALTVLTQGINGIQSADFSKCCSVCSERKSVKHCAACKKVGYCSVECQKLHWSTHKKHCKRLAKEYQQELQEQEKMKKLDEQRRQQDEKEKNLTSTDQSEPEQNGVQIGKDEAKPARKDDNLTEEKMSDKNIDDIKDGVNSLSAT